MFSPCWRSILVQILAEFLVQTLVKGITQISISLLIEVVLVDRERLLTLPFHVLNQTPKPSLDLLLAVCGLVNIPHRACNEPMACLMNISLNTNSLASRIPVMFTILLRRELGALCRQKQRNALKIDVVVRSLEQILVEGGAALIEANALLVEVPPEQHHCVLVKAQDFRASTETPLVERSGFRVRPKADPIPEHETSHF